MEYIYGTPGDEFPKAISGKLILTASDENVGLLLHFDIALDVLRRHRLLKPVDIVLLHLLGQADCLSGIIGVVGIHHENYVIPYSLSDGLHISHIYLNPIANLELHSGEAIFLVTECLLNQGIFYAGHILRLVEAGGIYMGLISISSSQ